MKAMGIDFGGRRIGVAVSDEDGRIAFPHCVIDSRKSLKAEFAPIISERNIERIVIGKPVTLRGEDGRMAEKAILFAERMKEWFGVECELWDERFTSAEADRAMSDDARTSRSGERDMTAATIILQSYLDFKNRA